MRILYLADIRFPLERANGIQSMATCHALAARGHQVSLVVRPDTHAPPRDPFEFYGLPRIAGLDIEIAPITGPAASRRVGYLTFAVGRSAGRARQDLIVTRDLGLASLLVRLPAALRAPLVYESHGIAADVAAALPDLLTGAPKASAAKLRRLGRREQRVWAAADGYVTITAGLAHELERRLGPRPRLAVVPDGAAAAAEYAEHAEYAAETGGAEYAKDAEYQEGANSSDSAASQHPDPSASSAYSAYSAASVDSAYSAYSAAYSAAPFTIGYAGHLYPWKGVDLVIEAVAALKDAHGLIVGGHEQEPDLARVKAFAAELDCASRITFTGMLPPSEVAARLRACDVLALPNPASALSNAFTSPLKLFEYMAAGRPIVASDLPSLREVLRHEANAILVAPGDPQALVAGIERIRQDPDLAARLARQARADVREYTWARRAERLERLFDQVREARA